MAAASTARAAAQRCCCAALILVGCGEQETPAPVVVQNWTVGNTPVASIGVVDGDERYTFGFIGGAALTRGGRIAVVDRVAMHVRLFDANGTYIATAGRAGSGPGEFRLPVIPSVYRGDSIAVFDQRLRRISIFDANGNHGRDVTLQFGPPAVSRSLRPEQGCCVAYESFADGSFILEYPGMIPHDPGPPRHSLAALVRLSPEGQVVDTIGEFPSRYYYRDATGDMRSYKLSSAMTYVTLDQSLYVGNGQDPTLLKVDGERADTVKLDMLQQDVTGELKADFEKGYRKGYERNPRNFEGSPNSLWEGEYMERAPAYTRVMRDPAGYLWLRQWQLPYADEPVPYHVVTRSGEHIANVAIPNTAVLAAIGRDAVLLIERDSLDVQYVRRYKLVRQ